MILRIGKLKEEELLTKSIKNFALNLEQNRFIQPLVKQVFSELERKGFSLFRPHLYLGDEWFSPEGEASISIPFYLAHSRLRRLEHKHTGEAEGAEKEEFLKLLRHEIGHTFDHVYKLSKTKSWENTFGNPKKKYNPDNYSFDPKSKDFVTNLKDHYAQAHPDEDFSETFSVWLEKKPSDWKREYSNKPNALKKLNYIEKTLPFLKDKKLSFSQENCICKASTLRISLKSYYNKRRKQLAA